MRFRSDDAAWAATTVLAVGAMYEVLVASEVVHQGDVPGEGARGAGIALAASLLAYLVGAGASFVRSLERRGPPLVWALLAPVGAVFLVADWYTFDAYYLPTLRRYSDGEIPGPWVVAVCAAAVVAGLLALGRPRVGAAASFVVLLFAALTVFVMPLGKWARARGGVASPRPNPAAWHPTSSASGSSSRA